MTPIQLQIETTNICNADCVFCPYSKQERPKGVMSNALFASIIGQAIHWPNIYEVSLQGLGEPLLDRDIVERVRMVHDMRSLTSAHREDWQISMYTNGHSLTPEKAKALEDAGLSVLFVSLNAASQEKRKAIMRLDDYETVKQNVIEARRICRRMPIIPKAIVGLDLISGEEANEFARLWQDKNGDGTMMHYEGNWAGSTWKMRTPSLAQGCHRALGQIMVLWDGRVSLCCFDAHGEVIFGDLSKQSLAEVYASAEAVRYRESHERGVKAGLKLCDGCTEI